MVPEKKVKRELGCQIGTKQNDLELAESIAKFEIEPILPREQADFGQQFEQPQPELPLLTSTCVLDDFQIDGRVKNKLKLVKLGAISIVDE